jgi:DNA-binding NarL/FixJ family response regulator
MRNLVISGQAVLEDIGGQTTESVVDLAVDDRTETMNRGKIANNLDDFQEAIADAADFRERTSLLTQREQEVMELVAEGCSNKAIGAKLGISPRTVEIHRGRLMTKLRVTSTAELVRYITKYEIFGKLLTA